MSIEEMRAELEAAGYKIVRAGKEYDSFWRVITPDRFQFDYDYDTFENWEEKAELSVVSKAHSHLQEKRQFEAMKTALNKIIESAAGLEAYLEEYPNDGAAQMAAFAELAREALGKD